MVKFNIYKNHNSFVVSYNLHKKRYRPTFKTEDDAKKFIEEKQLEIDRENAKDVLNISEIRSDLSDHFIQKHEIHTALTKYLEFKKKRITSHRQYVKYRNFCNKFYKYFFDKNIHYLHEIDLQTLEVMQNDWLDAGLQPSSVNRVIKGALGPFLAKCVKWGYIKNSPAFLLDCLAQKEKEGRTIWTEKETDKISTSLLLWGKNFLRGLDEFIARPIELSRLRVSDIDFEKGILILWSFKGKGSIKRVRHIPLTDEQMKFLRDLIEYNEFYFHKIESDLVFRNSKGGAVNPEHFARVVRSARRDKKLRDDLVPYARRHKGISELAEQNVSLSKIKRIAGQSNSYTTLGYVQHEIADLRNVVELRQARKVVGGDSRGK